MRKLAAGAAAGAPSRLDLERNLRAGLGPAFFSNLPFAESGASAPGARMCYPNRAVPSPHRSIAGAVVLSVLHVPCCALPLAVVIFGAGGALAPWAAHWSAWAHWTLPVAFGVLAYSWWRISGPHRCPRVRRQRRILVGMTAILVTSIVVAHWAPPAIAVAAAH